MGVIVKKDAGQEVPVLYLDQMLPKYNGSAGVMGVVVKDGVSEVMLTRLDVGATIDDVTKLLKEHKDIPVLAWFGEAVPTDDSIQPFVLYETGEGALAEADLAVFAEGPYPQYKEADDARPEHFHLAYKGLAPLIEEVWNRNDGDVKKVMAELNNPFAIKAMRELSTGDGFIALMSSSSDIILVGRDLTKGTFSWGFTSDPMGYFEGKQQDQGGKPKSFGFVGKAVAAVTDVVTRKPKVALPEGVHEVPTPAAAPVEKTGETTIVRRKKVEDPPAAGTGKQPVIADTRTATAIPTSTGMQDKVWLAPPPKDSRGQNNNNSYRHRFYGIYYGAKNEWPEEIMKDDNWKKGIAILVDRSVVRAEHKSMIRELNGLERVANTPVTVKPTAKAVREMTAAPTPKTAAVEDSDVPIIPQAEMDNVEDYITSTAFKTITDRAGELLERPEEWAKMEESYPSYTDLLQIQLDDTIQYNYKALVELGSRSVKSLAILLIEWRREALKNRPRVPAMVAAAEAATKPATTTVMADAPVRKKKVVN